MFSLTRLLLTLTDVSITCAVVIFRVKVSCITSGLYRNDVLQKSNENVGGGGGGVKGNVEGNKRSNFAKYNI